MPGSPTDTAWWERPWAVAALVLVSALPLLWPDVPPLLDLPGHMARYRVQLDLAGSPPLQGFYSFRWGMIGNLGVDLLVVPLSELFGLELAVKLVVLAIPPVAVAGFLWTAHEVHGRVPPTALFAVPLAYNFPFQFGFVNFSLGMALAFIAFALWLRLGRMGRVRLRAALFVPVSLIVWLAHTHGWGTLGLLVFAAEFIRRRGDGIKFVEAGLRAALACLPLVPPLILMAIWRNPYGGLTGNWLNIVSKINYVKTPLRDRWELFDLVSLAIIAGLIITAIRSRRFAFSRPLAFALLLLSGIYLLLPGTVFGSGYADMRLMPYLFLLALLGIRLAAPADRRLARALALAGLAFFAIRTGATTASFYLYDKSFDHELAALDHVPRGARLVSFVGAPCRGDWTMARLDHLPGMAVVRREAFSNDQWSVAGAQLLLSVYAPAGEFGRDPSQIVGFRVCPNNRWRSLNRALAEFPRAAFDYVWLINPPPFDPRLIAGLTPVWQSGRSALFRIEHGKGLDAVPDNLAPVRAEPRF